LAALSPQQFEAAYEYFRKFHSDPSLSNQVAHPREALQSEIGDKADWNAVFNVEQLVILELMRLG
jgi:hypothetical protein